MYRKRHKKKCANAAQNTEKNDDIPNDKTDMRRVTHDRTIYKALLDE